MGYKKQKKILNEFLLIIDLDLISLTDILYESKYFFVAIEFVICDYISDDKTALSFKHLFKNPIKWPYINASINLCSIVLRLYV